MKAKLLNGKEVDVLELDPAGVFGVCTGVLGRVIVNSDEFTQREGLVYLAQKVSETPDECRETYEILVRNCTDLEIPPLEEMLENDGAVIAKADYALEICDDGTTYMRFGAVTQFDCLYYADENGVINIGE